MQSILALLTAYLQHYCVVLAEQECFAAPHSKLKEMQHCMSQYMNVTTDCMVHQTYTTLMVPKGTDAAENLTYYSVSDLES